MKNIFRFMTLLICVLVILSSCSNNQNNKTSVKINSVKMGDKTINLTEENHSINACYIKAVDLKYDLWGFHSGMSISSVKFDKKEFLKLGIEIKELKKVDIKKEIEGFSNCSPFYYSKYVTEKDDIVFIVFDKDLEPLQMIDYYDTLYNEKEKKEYDYKEMKKDMDLKQVIKKIDL